MTDQPGRIVVAGLSKHFGSVRAVNNLSFSVEPGSVTGFLGPNGAGKTTTLRMLLGLVTPDAGTATIGGVRYADIPRPSRVVGAVLEASSFHPARSGRNHLRVYCATMGIPDARADEVLETVGLRDAARRKVRGYSLGMRQRLGLAYALIGDPQVLILDEPANGLDPEGIRWLREFMRLYADTGRTVLVSSHLLGEVEQVADRVVILTRGELIRQGTLDELTAGQATSVVVRSPNVAGLSAAVGAAGGTVLAAGEPGLIRVTHLPAEAVGHAAFTAGVELHELRTERSDLEQVFFQLTGDGSPTNGPGTRTGGPTRPAAGPAASAAGRAGRPVGATFPAASTRSGGGAR